MFYYLNQYTLRIFYKQEENSGKLTYTIKNMYMCRTSVCLPTKTLPKNEKLEM